MKRQAKTKENRRQIHSRAQMNQQRQQEQRTVQAFTSLLALVEALPAIIEQNEQTSPAAVDFTSRAFATGHALAQITAQVLDCCYIHVFALGPQDHCSLMLGSSGLTSEQEEQVRREATEAPLSDYIDASAIAQLHAQQVVMLDLEHQPFVKSHPTFGVRYRFLAPMVLRGQLVGLFVIAKSADQHVDATSPFSPEEIGLVKAVARLSVQVIEHTYLWQQWMEVRANELALQEANQLYDTFFTIAGHELRTPLTAIKGNLQLALRRLQGLREQAAVSPVLGEQLERLSKPLQYAAQRANIQERMISELLDASRVHTNRLMLAMQPLNLVELVHDIVRDIKQTATDHQIVLCLPAEPSIPIMADADRIGQVLSNYLSNAFKYSPAEHPITVSLTRDAAAAGVAVTDRGPGLSPEQQQRVWERFYRAPGEAQSGLGLGLYLCRMIIASHQGKVGVESAPGEGSTFWFTLPLLQA